MVILAAVAIGLIYRELPPGNPTNMTGRADVRDGDSLDLNGYRIRLEGIDAPELAQTCSRGSREWPCGEEARRYLERLIANHSVHCKAEKRDRFDRYMAHCRSGDLDLNRTMVEHGMAVAFGNRYRDAERAARDGRLGLWAGRFERPQAWRRKNPR